MDEHQHTPPSVEVLQTEVSRLQQIIDVQRDKLAAADDKDTAIQAQVRQMQNGQASLAGMLSQVVAENRVLRKRLGIGEAELVAVDDVEDAAEIGDAQLQDPAPDA